MNTYSDENQIRRYLLGQSSPTEREQVEEKLFCDDEYEAELLLCEDELIDDYARNLLSANERDLFEKYFAYSPRRREKLMLARAAIRVAIENQELISTNPICVPQPIGQLPVNDQTSDPQPNRIPPVSKFSSHPQPNRVPSTKGTPGGWIQKLFTTKPAIAYAAILAVLTMGGFWIYTHRPEAQQNTIAQKVTSELNRAYSSQRPFEARIIGFNHAPFPIAVQLMGDKPDQIKPDSIALARAKYLLFEKEPDRANPKYRQAMGQYYMAQKQFDEAIKQLREGVGLAPADASLRADLGAALLGKIELDRQSEAGAKKEDVEECFSSLNKAIDLDPTLPEAIFNRALLKQKEKLRREALIDWERYLQIDSNSSWTNEARENLKQLEEELKKTSKKQQQRLKDFHVAYAARDSQQVLDVVSQSYTFNGNYIFEELLSAFLAARHAECGKAVKERLDSLAYIGDLVNSKKGDRYFSDLVHYYRQASAEQIDLSEKARQLMSRANFFYGKSQNDQAVELYEKAEALFIQAGNETEPIFAKSWIGQCHHQRSATALNLKAFNEVLPEAIKKKYRWMESNAYCGLANGHNSAGQFSQAIADSRQCGQVASDLDDQIGVIRSQYMQGVFYYDLGKHEENLRICSRGRELTDKISAEIRYSITFCNQAAWSLSALGLHESALAYQQEAVRMSEESASPRLKAYAYIYQGHIYAQKKDFANAIASTQQGITIGKELKDGSTSQDFQHRGLLQLGSIYRNAGQFTNALNAFDQAKSYYERNEKKAHFFSASKGRLLTLIGQGQDSEANKELEQVINLYEKYRQSIQEESNRNSFFDQEQGIYDIATDFAHTRLNDYGLALTYVELGRARTLHDQVENGWKIVTGAEVPDVEVKSGKVPRNSEEIRKELPLEAQLLEYAVLSDKLLIWVIGQPGIRCRQVKVSAKELNEKIERFLALIALSPDKVDGRWQQPGAELYDLLIAPVESFIDRQKPVYIIPDKQLVRLPFGALLSKTQRILIEDFVVGYAGSSNMFLDATNKARSLQFDRQERFLVVGNPQFSHVLFPKLDDLNASDADVLASAAFYASPIILVREKATKPAVLKELVHADVAYLAMHYVPNAGTPMLSSLPLTPSSNDDGALQVHELYTLKKMLPLRLLLLSACQTRGEHFIGGEGAIGASRPFEAAGVPLVVSSLWPVDASASAKLMVNFHRARKRSGMTAIAALRTAQLEMMREANVYRHPFFWAAFVSVGGYTKY